MAKITYLDKVALNENTDIPDNNKVKANDMNEIKNVVNTNDANVGDLADLNTEDISNIVNAINEVNDKLNYSTEEQRIGTWIDGKPIYRKVIQQNVSNADNGTIPTGISNASDMWIDTSNTFFKWTDFPWKVPIFYQANTNYLSAYINGTNIIWNGKLSNYNLSGTFYITINYTKTTD